MTVTVKTAAPTKKKRVSKKLKSSWRKHVDTTDVDNFLEEQRLEERLGDFGKLPDNELFALETSIKPVKLSSKQARREKIRNKPLRSQALLQPLTKVPDPIAKRNRVRTKDERKNVLIKKKEALLRSQCIFKKKDLQRVKDMQMAKQRRAERESKFDFKHDIWGGDCVDLIPATKAAVAIKAAVVNDEWIQGDVERHVIHGPGKMPKTIPKGIHKKPHYLKAVEVPHPGMSYNPSYDDHQKLLQLVVEKETKIIKEEKHIERVTKHMFSKVTPEERDENWLVELSEGLKPDVSNTDANEPADEYKAINPPVKNKEKSKKQRRKQKEQLQLREKLRQAKIEKKKLSDMLRLKYINKEIERTDNKVRIMHEKRQKKKEYQKYEAKRLGHNKFEEPDLEFNMSTSIAGSLRKLHKEGNLLTDRFKSLQKRNIIAPSVVRTSNTRPNVKRFDKPGHREDTSKNSTAKKLR